MSEISSYTAKDASCLAALEDFEQTELVEVWLSRYSLLYSSVTLKPPGRPSIAMVHCEGQRFENIAEFVQLYETVQDLFI